MKIPAILWDGEKKIRGVLKVDQQRVDFEALDFAQTNLQFSIEYKEINKVNYYRLFDLEVNGIEIITKDIRSNVFLMNEPQKIKTSIEKHKLLKTN